MNQCRIHMTALAIWLLLGIPTFLWWKTSLLWIVAMSWYAIVASHWSAYEGARAKQAVEEDT
jgi:hypothetical protein